MQDGACCSRLHVTCVIWAQLESIEVDQHHGPPQSCAHAQCSEQYGALHLPPFLTVPDRNSPSRAGVLTRDTRKVTKGFCLRPTSSMLGNPAARSTVRVSSPDRAPGSKVCNQSRGMLRTMAVRVCVCACAYVQARVHARGLGTMGAKRTTHGAPSTSTSHHQPQKCVKQCTRTQHIDNK